VNKISGRLNLFVIAVILCSETISATAAEPESKGGGAASGLEARQKTVVRTADGKYELAFDTSETPALEQWVQQELIPMAVEWYPKLVRMLPSEGYEAPDKVSVTFSKEMKGVAATGGNRIRCAAEWFEKNLKGEAKGAVFHELVHVVQNYGWGRRRNPEATRTPGWIVEGIPDYLRWFKYEPQSKGAEITKRNIGRAKYDGNYRISANFLNWVAEKKGEEFIVKLNAAAREGRYAEGLWKEWTCQTVQEIGKEWKKTHETRLQEPSPAKEEHHTSSRDYNERG